MTSVELVEDRVAPLSVRDSHEVLQFTFVSWLTLLLFVGQDGFRLVFRVPEATVVDRAELLCRSASRLHGKLDR